MSGRGGDIWSLGRAGGLGGGAEGKRNISQARGRCGPSFLGRPFSQRARFPSGGSESTPRAGVPAGAVPSWKPSIGGGGGGERWGFGSGRTKPSVTMRYWGAGGGEAARLNGGPGPRAAPLVALPPAAPFPWFRQARIPGPTRDPHGSLPRRVPHLHPPPAFISPTQRCVDDSRALHLVAIQFSCRCRAVKTSR